MDGCQSMMKSVLDDLRPELDQKCGKSLILSHRSQGFFSTRQTVNGKFYCEFLRRMRSKHPAQTSGQLAQQLLGPESWQRSGSRAAPCAAVFGFYEYDSHPPPPYSPDLATCVFFLLLFPKMKLKLKGRRVDSIKAIQTLSQNAMNTLTWNDFQKFFRSWKSSCNRCINAKVFYFEGEGGE